VRKNLVISFVQKHVQLLVSVGSVIVLSRLVSPEETGVFSIGVAIAALTHAVRDFGVGNFLVKEAELNIGKVRTAFTVSLIIAAVLCVVLLAASVPVARFYNKPEVATVIWLTTLGLLISPFSTVNMALMLRDGRFPDMFKASMASAFANAGVSILCAWHGMGATALALGTLASSVALVLVSNLLMRDFGMYQLSLGYWGQISRFGMHMTVSGVADQLGQRASDLIVGKLVGFGAVGLLSRSGTLITMVQDSMQSSIMPVVLTSMAEDTRKTGNFVPLMLKSLSYFTVVMWPVFALISIYAHDAILVLFGAKWIGAAPYTSILCVGAGFAAMTALVSTVCNAADRAHLLSRYSSATQGVRVLLIAIGALLGDLRYVVGMLVLAEMIQCVLAYQCVRRAVEVDLGRLVLHCWRSLIATALVVLVMLPLSSVLPFPPLVRLLIVSVAGVVAWIGATCIVRHPIVHELHSLRMLIASRLRAPKPRSQP
jgi:O-antigen/teichoic acid export membrane protein